MTNQTKDILQYVGDDGEFLYSVDHFGEQMLHGATNLPVYETDEDIAYDDEEYETPVERFLQQHIPPTRLDPGYAHQRITHALEAPEARVLSQTQDEAYLTPVEQFIQMRIPPTPLERAQRRQTANPSYDMHDEEILPTLQCLLVSVFGVILFLWFIIMNSGSQ